MCNDFDKWRNFVWSLRSILHDFSFDLKMATKADKKKGL